MEARRLDPADDYRRHHAITPELSELDQPFTWRGVISLIHPYVWALIAALWIGLAWLILYEAS